MRRTFLGSEYGLIGAWAECILRLVATSSVGRRPADAGDSRIPWEARCAGRRHEA